ncbi:uncharacterized protein LOC135164871 isoform X2 [Diachasmimorpha longicaudata]|uniref:uncharacterized protein LOC135164871 isoform X2 n=1 Tax=Diachasmimorpha longicaudata TaxID=58733 RepID=UPI0030B8B3CE
MKIQEIGEIKEPPGSPLILEIDNQHWKSNTNGPKYLGLIFQEAVEAVVLGNCCCIHLDHEKAVIRLTIAQSVHLGGIILQQLIPLSSDFSE